MIEIHPLPFQQDLEAIVAAVGDLRLKVHPESDLAEALDRVEAILSPYWGNVEWQTPITAEEIDFRRSLSGMKL